MVKGISEITQTHDMWLFPYSLPLSTPSSRFRTSVNLPSLAWPCPVARLYPACVPTAEEPESLYSYANMGIGCFNSVRSVPATDSPVLLGEPWERESWQFTALHLSCEADPSRRRAWETPLEGPPSSPLPCRLFKGSAGTRPGLRFVILDNLLF